MAFAQQSEQELPAAEEEFLVTEEGGQREQSGILRGSKHLRVPIGIGVVAVLAVIACLASSAGLTSSRGRSQSSGGLTSSRRRSQSSGSQSGHSFGFVGLAKGGKEDDDGGKGRRRRHNHHHHHHHDSEWTERCVSNADCYEWESETNLFCFEQKCAACSECHDCEDGADYTCGSCGDGFPLSGETCVANVWNAPYSDEGTVECVSSADCEDASFCQSHNKLCAACSECHLCHDGVDETCGSCGDGFPLQEDSGNCGVDWVECSSSADCTDATKPFCYQREDFLYTAYCAECSECHVCHDGADETCGSCGDGFPLHGGLCEGQ